MAAKRWRSPRPATPNSPLLSARVSKTIIHPHFKFPAYYKPQCCTDFKTKQAAIALADADITTTIQEMKTKIAVAEADAAAKITADAAAVIPVSVICNMTDTGIARWECDPSVGHL